MSKWERRSSIKNEWKKALPVENINELLIVVINSNWKFHWYQFGQDRVVTHLHT